MGKGKVVNYSPQRWSLLGPQLITIFLPTALFIPDSFMLSQHLRWSWWLPDGTTNSLMPAGLKPGHYLPQGEVSTLVSLELEYPGTPRLPSRCYPVSPCSSVLEQTWYSDRHSELAFQTEVYFLASQSLSKHYLKFAGDPHSL